MNAPRPITYHDAFFSAEDREEPSFCDIHFECEATCFHEAGHAVVSYVLGLGLSRVDLRIVRGETDEGRPGVAFGGFCVNSKREIAAASRDIRERGYCRAALTDAVPTCAGPAAEFRYCSEMSVPRRLLWGTIGDHMSIDRTAKYLESGGDGRFRTRNRFAFQRLAWREAQKLIARDDVWDAVGALATALYETSEGWEETEESVTYTLPGAVARGIIRRAGVVAISNTRR